MMELSLKNLSKKYRDKYGLKNFSLTINEGILGLLGPNGAGKSTLMNIIATVSQPSVGSVSFNGVDVVKKPDTVRKVLGYLPQDFGTYSNLNAIEFLMYMAALKGVSGKQARHRVEVLLEQFNLTPVMYDPIGTYSGGMRQRIGLAQVLLANTQLLILDEPFAGLDPEERIRFRNLISDLSGQRIVIISSHIVSDLETIAHKIALINQGSLRLCDYPDKIVNTLEGRVFAGNIPDDRLNTMKSHYLISHSLRNSTGWRIRFICDSPENLNRTGLIFKPVKATLEDAYFYITSSINEQKKTGHE